MQVYEMGSKVAALAWLEAQRWQVVGVERLWTDLMEDLLAGRVPTVPGRRAALAERGLTADTTYLLLLASITRVGPLPDALDPLSEVRRELAGRVGGLLVTRGQEVYGALPVAPDDAAVVAGAATGADAAVVAGVEAAVRRLSERGIDVRIGLSGTHADLSDVPRAAIEAARAHEVVGPSGWCGSRT